MESRVSDVTSNISSFCLSLKMMDEREPRESLLCLRVWSWRAFCSNCLACSRTDNLVSVLPLRWCKSRLSSLGLPAVAACCICSSQSSGSIRACLLGPAHSCSGLWMRAGIDQTHPDPAKCEGEKGNRFSEELSTCGKTSGLLGLLSS